MREARRTAAEAGSTPAIMWCCAIFIAVFIGLSIWMTVVALEEVDNEKTYRGPAVCRVNEAYLESYTSCDDNGCDTTHWVEWIITYEGSEDRCILEGSKHSWKSDAAEDRDEHPIGSDMDCFYETDVEPGECEVRTTMPEAEFEIGVAVVCIVVLSMFCIGACCMYCEKIYSAIGIADHMPSFGSDSDTKSSSLSRMTSSASGGGRVRRTSARNRQISSPIQDKALYGIQNSLASSMGSVDYINVNSEPPLQNTTGEQQLLAMSSFGTSTTAAATAPPPTTAAATAPPPTTTTNVDAPTSATTMSLDNKTLADENPMFAPSPMFGESPLFETNTTTVSPPAPTPQTTTSSSSSRSTGKKKKKKSLWAELTENPFK